ncbi:MAG: phosphate acyltransferase PlsX [Spirochaetia bacterium]|nr:phosphate acyltransferase PlsX [Spirochaetia bacterium]
MWIAIDTVSGDLGPEPIVNGALMAVKEFDARVILVGDRQLLSKLISGHKNIASPSNIRIENSDSVVQMSDQPAKAVRAKPHSSIMVCSKLVKNNEAIGLFSPGNTGATMAASLLVLGRLPGVKRPAVITPLPRNGSGATVLLDAGANVDCKAEYLVQFAIMGEIYSREILGILHPAIGLLSNGEEDNKGNELTQNVFKALKKLPVYFVGNVEGRDLFGFGKPVDVVVCDGFIGNIAIKTIEGTAKAIFNTLKRNIEASPLAKTGALFLKPTLQAVKGQMDHSNYGGAPLLGVNGIVLIGHGSSNAWAVRNAIKTTLDFARHEINRHIIENIKQFT